MPELPEVEFARGCLERWLQGRVLRAVHAAPSRLLRGADARRFEACVGRAVERVERRGKWLRIHCAGDAGWLMHLGMTGRVVRLPVDDRPHVRAVWRVEGDPPGAALIDPRGFGRLFPGSSADMDASVEWSQLGPDAWRESLTPSELALRASGRRAIKAALLDQQVLAGIGNIQATEALFLAGIRPDRIAASLADAEWFRLVDGLRTTLERTLALNEGDEITYVGEGGPNPFLVYGRTGEPCPTCATTLMELRVVGRGGVICTDCQR